MIFPPKFPLVWSSRLSRRINFVKWNWHRAVFFCVCGRDWLQYHSKNGIFCFKNRMQSIKNRNHVDFCDFRISVKSFKTQMNKALLDFGLSFLFEEKSFIEWEKWIESEKDEEEERGTDGNMTTIFCSWWK